MGSKRTFDFQTRIQDRDFPLKIVRMAPQDATGMHCHEFTELVIIYEGKGLHSIGDDPPAELTRGNIFVIPKGVYHEYIQEDINLLNIIFDADLLPLPLLDVYSMPCFNMIFKGRTESHEIFNIPDFELEKVLSLAGELEIELNEHKPGFQFMATGLFMQIIMFLARAIADSVENILTPHIGISRTIEYMHIHFKEKISIEKLADASGMSTRSLRRHFKRVNGYSPKEYLIKLRINCACELLGATMMSIDEIAFNTGFNDSNYFSKEFRKITGTTPSKYRSAQPQN